MDKAKILRLLDEADDIVNALYRQGANKDYKYKSLREKLKAIAAEISEQPKSNADRIRQMTDEELVEDIGLACRHCQYFDMKNIICTEPDKDCKDGNLEWLKQEASEDVRTD